MATPIPKNQAAFSLAELVLATRGRTPSRAADAVVRGVTTDSRNVTPGELFVALVGDRFDGHDHVASACERGAAAVLVSRETRAPAGVAVITVKDTLAALGDLARAHRRRWGALGAQRRVVGITGSAGKTTTRHAITALLGAIGHAVHSSRGNLNNAIGVPMSLLGVEAQHELAVIEMGMNSPGEIAHVAAVAQPELGVVTLVAEAHTQGVGTVWDVLREKSDLLAALPASGVAVCNLDDALTAAALVRSGARAELGYGRAAGAAVRIVERAGRGLDGSDLTLELALEERVSRVEARVPLLGEAGALAAAAATAVALGVDPAVPTSELGRALGALGGNEGGRLSARTRADGGVIVDDAYNANPASMRSSVDAAREIAAALERPLVLVLGSMFELGASSDELHEAVGRHAAAARPALVVVVGAAVADPLAAGAAAGGANVARVTDAAAAVDALAGRVPAGAVVLVKASHSLGLSAVAARLFER